MMHEAHLIKTIVWDIDDVLNDLTRSWFELVWKKENPASEMKYGDIKQNPPYRLLGISREEYLASLDKFRFSAEADAIAPESGVLNWFNQWGAEYRHIALTARPIKTVPPAVSWLMRNFGEWFGAFGFVPSWRPDEHPRQPDRRKGDFLAWLHSADYFIDDHSENIVGTDKLGVRAFLVAQPWNNSDTRLMEILDTINHENGLG